ncbi:MAG TPA: aminodeoxychorismate/anthranilate synthase component II [Candidatus Nanopelagicaceae bacterium]|nr:aminodeoxychorismate/anthranilate synthase component II [Candidatus Nanopelagicaceae bacterium]
MILVVDHQDSFVYNLVQLVAMAGFEVQVVSSDSASAADLVALRPAAVILSPGPGRPEQAGCFVELVSNLPADIPLLGVCLGHQAIAVAFGAVVTRAPEPVHGKVSPIRHHGKGLFAGVGSPLAGGRYHSLVVDPATLPEELLVDATTEDGLVMALRHRHRPLFGVQFHPESVLTPDGPRLVDNFLAQMRVAG